MPVRNDQARIPARHKRLGIRMTATQHRAGELLSLPGTPAVLENGLSRLPRQPNGPTEATPPDLGVEAGQKLTEELSMNEQSPAQAGPSPIRVFILDDHELVRLGLQELLEGQGFTVVGSSGTAAEATRLIPALRPDVSVLDARLPDGTGIEVCRDVRSVDPTLRCLILTSYDDEQALRGAVLAGASGYVLKEIGGTDLLTAIKLAASGESLFDAALKRRIIAGLAEPAPLDPRVASLTAQERRVLALIGQGMTNRQIGGELFLAEKTVKNYVSSLLAKLGFERRTQAAVYITEK